MFFLLVSCLSRSYSRNILYAICYMLLSLTKLYVQWKVYMIYSLWYQYTRDDTETKKWRIWKSNMAARVMRPSTLSFGHSDMHICITFVLQASKHQEMHLESLLKNMFSSLWWLRSFTNSFIFCCSAQNLLYAIFLINNRVIIGRANKVLPSLMTVLVKFD